MKPKYLNPTTSDPHSPWDLLPAPNPKDSTYPDDFFYKQVAKHLLKDTVRMMDNGLHIDMDKVEALEETLIEVLASVSTRLEDNKTIRNFLVLRHADLKLDYVADRKTKLREPSYYTKEFKHKDMVHRSYFMREFLLRTSIDPPEELLPTGIPKWSANEVKKLQGKYPILQKLLLGTLPLTNVDVITAMSRLDKDKSDMYNVKYLEQIKQLPVEFPKFNPGSTLQLQKLFNYLGIESESFSKKTGLASWDRKQVERVNKLTNKPDVTNFTQAFIDHSYAAIVKNNFIEGFYNYSIDGRLYGTVKLLGAKSGRPTSANPNMLNFPSSGSIFSKPIKECFTAPHGFVIGAIDYAALNISGVLPSNR
jgi:hypothetical protein